MFILLRENISVTIEKHPFYKSLNEKILKETKNHFYQRDTPLLSGGVSNVKAGATLPVRISTRSIELVYEWILTLVRPKTNGWNLYVDTSWLAWYQREDCAISHDHHPSVYSFVYFLKCPKGSSPLIFTTSGKKIKAEEGKVVIFPGNLLHHVPKNKCYDRIVLAGNIFASKNDAF